MAKKQASRRAFCERAKLPSQRGDAELLRVSSVNCFDVRYLLATTLIAFENPFSRQQWRVAQKIFRRPISMPFIASSNVAVDDSPLGAKLFQYSFEFENPISRQQIHVFVTCGEVNEHVLILRNRDFEFRSVRREREHASHNERPIFVQFRQRLDYCFVVCENAQRRLLIIPSWGCDESVNCEANSHTRDFATKGRE